MTTNAVATPEVSAEKQLDLKVLRAACEVCWEGIAIVEHGCILFANQAFTNLCGFGTWREVSGKRLVDIIPKRNIQQHSVDFPFGLRDLKVISAQVEDLASTESEHPDLTNLMVAGVAHDFNNLLTAIRLYTDLMIPALDPGSNQHATAEKIRKAAATGKELIQQLLAATRQLSSSSAQVAWSEVVKSMFSLLQLLLGEAFTLTMDLSEPDAPVTISLSQARRVVLNLVLNARDSMPEGGVIALSSRPVEDRCKWVELRVTDQGCGMDDQTRSQIFRPFFTTKASGAGNGLGLYTVRKIVEQNGGTLRIESASGRGTEATVLLPVATLVAINSHSTRPAHNRLVSSPKRPAFSVVKPKSSSSQTDRLATPKKLKGKSQ